MANGVPSHDTFSRLFHQLDPAPFFAVPALQAKFSQCVVAINGKLPCRLFNRASEKSALHMVSAWGCEQRLVLAQAAR